VTVHDRGCEVDEFSVLGARTLAEQLVRRVLIEVVAFHQDALCALDRRASAERPP